MRFFSFSAILVCLTAAPATATVTIDQEYVAPTTVAREDDYSDDYMAQTFTARNTGQITSVALQLALPRFGTAAGDLQFKLTRTNSAGEPVLTDVLATSQLHSFDLPTDYAGLPMSEIDLRNQNVQVRSGDELALVLSTNGATYVWNYSLWFDEIAGGKFFVYSPRTFGARWFYQWNTTDHSLTGDAGYRITIDAVPEPSPALLGLMGIFAFIGLPHRCARTVGCWQSKVFSVVR